MGIGNKQLSGKTGSSRASRKARISHFEPLENRQMLSAILPVAPPAGSAKLTGALIGTAGSYQNKGNTIAMAIDGNTNTYFDAPSGVQGWMGFDLGVARTITQVQYVPRGGFASRMVGGIFQGSDTPDFSADVTNLYTVTASPSSSYTAEPVTVTGVFRYVRYLAPVTASGNVAELEFDGYTPVAAPVVPPAPVVPVIPVVPPAPNAPTGLIASNVSTTDVNLTWQEDAGSAATSFTVLREGPGQTTYTTVGSPTTTSFDDLTISPSTAYSYEVVANSPNGTSVATAPVSITTLAVVVPPVIPVIPVVPVAPVIPPVAPVVPTNVWSDSDIGAVGLAGSAVTNANGSITVSGSGADIWNTADAFNFDSQTFVGNGSIITQVTAQTNVSSWAKAGLMFRENNNVDARYVLLALTPGNGITLQSRTQTHVTPSVSLGAAGKTGVWLELVRNGSTFSGYSSTDDKTWTLVGTVNIDMVNNIQAGLAVTAHNNTKICTATFSNIAIAPAGTEASQWSVGATDPTARWESETFTYNNEMYVFGGYIDRSLDATPECDVYNPATDSWSMVTTMPFGALTHAGVTVVGSTVYFAGGDMGTAAYPHAGTTTSAVYTYNIATNVWGSVTSLPVAVSSGGLVSINNQLIYYGGINAGKTVDQSATWSLDLTNPSAKWIAEAAMPDARNHLGYAEINGIAYAIGGMHLYKQTTGNDSEVDAYNPVTNTWTTVASLPMAWGGIHDTTLVVNNKIVILGGQTNGGYDGVYLNNIEEYDPIANSWAAVGTLPEANQGESVAYINGTLIVADGTVDNEGGWAQSQTWLDSEIYL